MIRAPFEYEGQRRRGIGRAALRLAVILPIGIALLAQTDPRPAFEVASIRPSDPDGRAMLIHGGPGSTDPGLATLTNIDLFSLITMAYGIQRHQLVGPDWLSTAHFDITARIPTGTTPDQYRTMLQRLLAERFHLDSHRETRMLSVYNLIVAKGGSKLKESSVVPANVQDIQPPPRPATPPAGFKGAVNLQLTAAPMAKLTATLTGFLGEIVIDKTGLTGYYDLRLRALMTALPADSDSRELPLPDALQEQLGLRLEPAKEQVSVLVVDRIGKAPTEN